MQIELETSLDRWTQAALLNAAQAARIREFDRATCPRIRVPIRGRYLSLMLALWAEVTIPRKGPPRPIRLGVKRNGRIQPVPSN
jgi:hypothetical protein